MQLQVIRNDRCIFQARMDSQVYNQKIAKLFLTLIANTYMNEMNPFTLIMYYYVL